MPYKSHLTQQAATQRQAILDALEDRHPRAPGLRVKDLAAKLGIPHDKVLFRLHDLLTWGCVTRRGPEGRGRNTVRWRFLHAIEGVDRG